MKTIRSKILLPVILLIAVSLTLVGGISSWLNYSSTFATLNQTMTQTAAIAADRIAHHVKEYVNIALETGSIARLANDATKLADKKAIIDQRSTSYGFAGGGILDSTGTDIFTSTNYSTQEFFTEAKTGVHNISEPMVWDANGQLTVVLSAPLWEGGIPQSKVVGVIYYLTEPNFLANIVATVKVSPGGASYIIDHEGNTIAHQELSRVESGENIFEVAKKTPGLAPLADIHTLMVEGGTGFNTYTFGGIEKFLAYAPVSGTHGWSVAVNAPINDFMAETFFSIYLVIGMLALFVVMGGVVAYRLASGISKPVVEIAAAAEKLLQGDFRVSITHTSKDELGGLADSMRKLCSTVVGIIQGMDHELGAMSNNNFTVAAQSTELYVGDFATLRSSVDNIRTSLSGALTQINASADQVSSGSGQVSSGAQALSQGATEQASSIQELSATISEISNQVRKSAESAQTARQQSEQASDEVVSGNQRMQQMKAAMGDISGKSNEIGKIIKTIDDIAFQTNILALNAAVEAARAGAAGKGFAVVADEVRNLAGKSAEAAKTTTALIEETVKAIENGTKIADDTAQSMVRVVDGSRSVTGLIAEIADAANEQATSIMQVTTGLEQISSVVQTNSATAEQSAAASEELSSQAEMLKNLVGRFKLEKDAHGMDMHIGS